MMLKKINLTQQQALDLLSHMEVIEELLVTAISTDPDAELMWTTDQRAALAVDANIISSQCAHIAKNLTKL